MKKKAVFLDRDGTINVEKNYLYKIDEFEFLPGVTEALHMLQKSGYLLIVITNQSGIARGYYTEEDFIRLNDWMLENLKSQGIHIDKVYYCPHHPDAPISDYRVDCACRKPKLGLFMQAVAEFDLEIDDCFSIGDKIRDCGICEETECKGFLIGENEKTGVINRVKNGLVKNVRYTKNLLEAAKQIVG